MTLCFSANQKETLTIGTVVVGLSDGGWRPLPETLASALTLGPNLPELCLSINGFSSPQSTSVDQTELPSTLTVTVDGINLLNTTPVPKTVQLRIVIVTRRFVKFEGLLGLVPALLTTQTAEYVLPDGGTTLTTRTAVELKRQVPN